MKLCEIVISDNPILAGHIIKDALLEDDVKCIHVKPCEQFSYDIINKKFISFHNFWAECAKRIGELVPMEENVDGNKTGNIFTDIKYPWHQESKSFSHSNTRQPLHTDGSYEAKSPNISYFFCLEEPLYGGSTIFVSLEDLKNYISLHDSDLLNKLQNTIVTHYKGNDYKVRPILQENRLTWNYFRCESCKLRDEFHDFLEKYVVDGNLYESVKLKVGEALFFKDEEMLHGRTAFLGSRWLVKGGIHV